MSLSMDDNIELRTLVDALLDGLATDEQTDRLSRALAADAAAVDFYLRRVFVTAFLREGGGGVAGLDLPRARSEEPSDGGPGQAQGRAPSLKLPHLRPARAWRAVRSRQRTWPRPRTWGMAAGMVLVIGLAVIAVLRHARRPSTPPPGAVAILSGSNGAQWEGDLAPPAKGAALAVNSPLALVAGVAEVTCGGGTKVILEAPARFSVESPKAVRLVSGKLVATVAGGSFVVDTPGATVTDLGTEFGVSAAADGTTEVDVFRGAVRVESAARGANVPQPQVLFAGEAATASASAAAAAAASAAAVTRLPGGAVASRFVRSLDGGHTTPLDLVDLCRGGNGTPRPQQSQPQHAIGIDATSGLAGALEPVREGRGDGRYHRVVGQLSVVDGCFVPDGSLGPVQVDSAGHTFGFPATAGTTFNHIWMGGAVPTPVGHIRAFRTAMGGVDYTWPGHGLLYMHSNEGLTVDLSVVRRMYPGRRVVRFHCMTAMARVSNAQSQWKADVYLLVDGRSRFEERGITVRDGPFAVDVPIEEGERFLTLAVTDAGDGTVRDDILWGDPTLEVSAQ